MEQGADPNSAGIEVVGNPQPGEKMVMCSKREWEWWVNALRKNPA